jgi:UrcA family protein
MTRALATLLALSFGCNSIGSDSIAEPNGEAHLLISYDDLDLSKPKDLDVLRHRLERAVDEACMKAAGPAPGQQMDLGCRADALALARAQIAHAIQDQRLKKSPAVADSGPR